MVAQTASTYTGPFESLYEEHEAAAGNRGHQAAYMASQAQHSRALREKGLPDTSFFGTRRDLFGNDYYETAAENPLNYAMQFANRPETSYTQSSGAQMAANQFRPEMLTKQGMQGSGGFLPFMSGGSGYMGASPKAKTGIGQFFTDLGNSYRRSRQDLGMGIANLFSGGAFSNDVDKKVQGLKDFGYSVAAARDYVQRTQEQARRLRFENALYGDNKPGQNVGGGQPAISEEILNETNNENVDAASSDAYNLYVAPNLLTTSPIQMAQGGLMSLRRR